MRSAWKYTPVLNSYKSKVFVKHCRIGEDFIDRRVGIYTGRKFFSIYVRPFMLHKIFGSFVGTTRTGRGLHVKFKKVVSKSKGKKK